MSYERAKSAFDNAKEIKDARKLNNDKVQGLIAKNTHNIAKKLDVLADLIDELIDTLKK